MRARALSGMERLLITNRIELMSDTETLSSAMSSGMVMSSGSSEDDGGDAWSSPLPSVVALGSLDERVE